MSGGEGERGVAGAVGDPWAEAAVAFHPLVAQWLRDSFAAPTAAQRGGWRHIAAGADTLIAAPTGSGKTLTAFLRAVDELVRAAAAGALQERVHAIYVSPLKALGNDIEKNLRVPLSGVAVLARAAGKPLPEIRVAVRTGDTPAGERRAHLSKPPHLFVTTPESLYILLTSERGREMLRTARAVIVDEIHAIAADKRGAHLALTLERLDHLAGRRLQRIGLSATQKPIEEVARLLVGAGRCDPGGTPRCAIVDVGHRRPLQLSVETPGQELGAIASLELRDEIYDRLASLILAHRTTIVFVNTRRLVERVAHALSDRLGKGKIAAHHGSLSRETRLAAENGLKCGAIRAIVASASLELGIDVGHVDLVCHLGAPRSLATLLQRVGRSGHSLGATPVGRFFPLTRDELVQCAAAVRAVRTGELDAVELARCPLDILAQQVVATVATGEIGREELWNLVRRAHPYRELRRDDFDAVVAMLSEGVSSRRGRRSAHVHADDVHGVLRPRRGARLAATTRGGAIPDVADYDVVEDSSNALIGKVNEDFAIESLAGDVILLGNRSWRIRRVEAGRVRVVDANGQPPTVPFWLGEAPARTLELSAAVAALRRDVAERAESDDCSDWLMRETGVDRAGAEQIVAYVRETVRTLGTVPTLDTVVAERFFDEAGGMQLVLHAPFGGRINRALGLSLRKRFCLRFDFELQAAATDDGIVLSLGEQHSFALDGVFSMQRAHTFEADLVQAALVSPMFTNRWRWNATRALALLRFRGGRKVAMPVQRMRAEDLLAAVFPAQLACGDNRVGPIEVPDHPLVAETLDNCLHEAMDSDGLRRVLGDIEAGRILCLAVDTPAPSPMSHEILNAYPYAFLDDAPLEERRARAVSLRRTDPELAAGIGALDASAVAEVRRGAWPTVRDADEAHDALLTLRLLPEEEADAWSAFLATLAADRRALHFRVGGRGYYAASQRWPAVRAIFAGATLRGGEPLPVDGATAVERQTAVYEVVRGWMDCIGPVAESALARRLGLTRLEVGAALARLEADGVVLRGNFSGAGEELCERGLLARIHRRTVQRLRREIEPVSAAELMRFLQRWQHLTRDTALHGRDGVRAVIRQLRGVEVTAPAWEEDLLPARVRNYDPADLEYLALSGEVAWGRLAISLPDGGAPVGRPAPSRVAPLAFALREELPQLLAPVELPEAWRERLSAAARDVHAALRARGASFAGDLARLLGRPAREVEEALWELVACGLVTGDGVAGLRALLERRRARKGGGRALPIGRWALLREVDAGGGDGDEHAESVAMRLLHRYGVVLRELCLREKYLPAWRRILHALRRLEARGVVRGGRFVSGFVGEQFALPEALDSLRAARRRPAGDEVVLVAAADPLNLVGILTAGPRVAATSGLTIAYRAGSPIAWGRRAALCERLAGGGPVDRRAAL